MRYRALDINLLVMLEILIDSLSITKTAETLGLTQPAISSALGRLRDHFGDELLVQVGRANVLTPLAERLRAPLKDVLHRTDALISQRVGFDPATDRRRFSFIGSDYIATTFGNLILKQIALAGPGLSAQLEHLGPEAMVQFERAQIDAIIGPKDVMTAGHPTLELFQEHFVCVVWDQHPTIGDQISVEEFVQARHVVNSFPGNKFVSIDEWFLTRANITRDVAVQVSAFADMIQIVPGTPFVATVQSRLARRMKADLPIRILPAPLEFPTMQIFVQWHSRLGDDEGARWFRSKIVDIVARLDS